jgi:hypothetical protein
MLKEAMSELGEVFADDATTAFGDSALIMTVQCA